MTRQDRVKLARARREVAFWIKAQECAPNQECWDTAQVALRIAQLRVQELDETPKDVWLVEPEPDQSTIYL